MRTTYERDYLKSTVALLTAMALWGSTFITTKIALNEVPPFLLTSLRFIIGFGILLPFAYQRGFRFNIIKQPVILS
ncbi:drug/metabolite transporter (DMT)-like permease [Caldalkalibacillus uzonensis]|uniref:Drug/metabolite transporter (DMT)-like permease n=1 Tax=Caldalkalibacillus uzonensis TaxID=353224 RepID=A0ABU0CX21_9BACI|nr:EamA family transporter [Caldalkalibacillus uzonensis]MDQ0340471.1 drug/metabolite transporter (DMT)-like permease [Caldalkalibacillus uzonensis]